VDALTGPGLTRLTTHEHALGNLLTELETLGDEILGNLLGPAGAGQAQRELAANPPPRTNAGLHQPSGLATRRLPARLNERWLDRDDSRPAAVTRRAGEWSPAHDEAGT
jgi:hypothetical protein